MQDMLKNEEKLSKLNKLINEKSFGRDGVCEFIPQREPFLMIDSVIEINVFNKKVICQKHINSDEWYLHGHFPNNPVMPGVLMVESMAQAASIIGEALTLENDGIILFAGIEKCNFHDIATVGDTLIIEAEITNIRGPLIIGNCCVKKNDKIIVDCKLKAFKKAL